MLACLPAALAAVADNIYSDWDKPKNAPPPGTFEPSPLVPDPTAGPRGVPSPLIAGFVYVTQLQKMSAMAGALGEEEDAALFGAMAEESAAVFLEAFLRRRTEDGERLFSDGGPLPAQSAQALALALFQTPGLEHLLPNATADAAYRELVDATLVAKNHSYCGIIGQRQLYPVMSRRTTAVRSDKTGVAASPALLALKMNIQTSTPSFGSELAQGATTLWEMFGGGGTDDRCDPEVKALV